MPGGSAPGGVPVPGGCLLLGGLLWGIGSGGCLLLGVPALGGSALGDRLGGVPALGGGIPACTEADPPFNRITDACKNITLPQLRCGF